MRTGKRTAALVLPQSTASDAQCGKMITGSMPEHILQLRSDMNRGATASVGLHQPSPNPRSASGKTDLSKGAAAFKGSICPCNPAI